MGVPSKDYPYPFSIYQWLEGKSLNLVALSSNEMEQLALDLAKFLKELHKITEVKGPIPGQHNWWRGEHISIYDQSARKQIIELADVINKDKAIDLWERASDTKWHKSPVWIHGDFAIGNMIIKDSKLSAIIDFGWIAVGDPACDLVIAWTYLSGKSQKIFIDSMGLDKDTWLRARAWALWKATFELCQLLDKNDEAGLMHKKIIQKVLLLP